MIQKCYIYHPVFIYLTIFQSVFAPNTAASDNYSHHRRMQAGFVSMVVLTIACNEYYSAKYLEHIPEFPVESVRRTYEFPELLRNKYR